jgi:NAD(P)-dependent dehydrogenase (short-subunit alcohol dehydrogenase family)
MKIVDSSVVVTGGASGLGLATVRALSDLGASITILDLASSDGVAVAKSLPGPAQFVATDVTDASAVASAFSRAVAIAPVRAVVHAAGRGGSVRLLDREGRPADAELFRTIQEVNVTGTFNVLQHAAAAMAVNEESSDDGRGVIVLTASVAAYEGQVGQIGYAASKAAVVGMTLTAARDLGSRAIRVCAIAPGVVDTPMYRNVPVPVQERLAESVPYPRRAGMPEEYAHLAAAVIANPYLNGETIRLDGALRLGYK